MSATSAGSAVDHVDDEQDSEWGSGREASAESVMQSIRRVRQATETWVDAAGNEHERYDEDCRLQQMTHLLPPGFGSIREEPECGTPMTWFCEDCLEIHEAGATCGKFECPRCAPVWCRDRAMNAVQYLLALRHKKYGDTGRNQFFHHVIISPSPDWCPDSKEPLERTWAVVKEIAEEMGMAGYAAFHLWSGGDGVEDDRGEWKKRMFQGRDWESDVKNELSPRPHFHLFVAADFVKGQEFSKRVEDETGWVIHRIADDETGRSIDGGEDDPMDAEALAASVTYALSHTIGYETDSGNTKGFWRPFGFRHKDVDVYDGTAAEAAEAVRETSARTLGIPSAKFQCHGEKEVEVAADHSSVVDEQGGEYLADEWAVEDSAGRAGGSVRDDRGTSGSAGDLDRDRGGGTSGGFSDKMTPAGELRAERERRGRRGRRARRSGGAGGSGGLAVVSDPESEAPSERRRERAEVLREGGTVTRAVECRGTLRKIESAPQFYEDTSRPREKRRRLFEAYVEACERWGFLGDPPSEPPDSLRG